MRGIKNIMLKINIEKKLNNYSLDVNINFGNGITGLFGPSGSGKSMILKNIAGLEEPDNGVIVFDEEILFDKKKKINIAPQKRKIGYLFQDYAIFPHMTVYENIEVSVNKKYKNTDKEYLINEVMNDLKISQLKNKKPREISGGEKQRTAIARLIVNEPKFLLLDEPFSALDTYLKMELIENLHMIIDKLKISAILVSHNIEEIFALCKEMYVVENGKIIENGDVSILFNSPKSDFMIKSVECYNKTKNILIEG